MINRRTAAAAALVAATAVPGTVLGAGTASAGTSTTDLPPPVSGADLNARVAACNTGDPAQNWNLDRSGGTTPPTPGRPVIDLDHSRAPDLGPWLEQQKQTIADYCSTISGLVTKGAWTAAPRFRIVLDPQITDHPADARPGAVPENEMPK
ncbi:hypothetical protein WN990_13980 [Kitasatospora purpeofusca]|uniref:hypothetical protein n=1 Tax=Kitasatospora purpeofusca TaxID=67352 RepID=UPI0030F0597B